LKRIIKTAVIFLVSGLSFTARAQSLQPAVIASDGGFVVLTSGSISWTMGETVTETFSSPGNYLTQGFHQPKLLMVSVIGTGLTSGAGVYPNPTTAFLYINLNNLANGNYDITFFDVIGNKIKSIEGDGGGSRTLQLDLTDLANGAYLLSITGTQFSQSFKVIKTK
jgi:hypothetical protein